MKQPIISIIAAISENRAIGKDNKLLWHIPEDMIRFKKITSGHPVIMGRKTYESMGKMLPNRINIIVTRHSDYQVTGGFVFTSLPEAINFAKERDSNEIFIIGGGEIYRQALPLADKLYLTVVQGNFEGDTFFPDYSAFKKVVKKEEHNDRNFHFTFLELER